MVHHIAAYLHMGPAYGGGTITSDFYVPSFLDTVVAKYSSMACIVAFVVHVVRRSEDLHLLECMCC